MGTAVAEKIEKSVAEKMRDGDLLTIEEAAGPLGVKDHWGVRNLIDHHGLPFIRHGKRGKRIDPADIQEWKQKHREIVTF
jgi:excisionase family DNA binding protein